MHGTAFPSWLSPAAPPTDDLTASAIEQQRAYNKTRLKTRFEAIFDKYEKDFTHVGDEVDLATGRIVVNNGHLALMAHDRDLGERNVKRLEVGDSEDELGTPSPAGQSKPSAPVKHPQPSRSSHQGVSPGARKVASKEMDPFIENGYRERIQSQPARPQKKRRRADTAVQPTSVSGMDPQFLEDMCRSITAGVMQAMMAAQPTSLQATEPAWRAPPLPQHTQRRNGGAQDRAQAFSFANRSQSLARSTARAHAIRATERSQAYPSIWAEEDTSEEEEIESTSSERQNVNTDDMFDDGGYDEDHTEHLRHSSMRQMDKPRKLSSRGKSLKERQSIAPRKVDRVQSWKHRPSGTTRTQTNEESATTRDRYSPAEHSPYVTSEEGLDEEEKEKEEDDEDEEVDIWRPSATSQARSDGASLARWTAEEDELLSKLKWEDKTPHDTIAEYFPARSREAVRSRIKALRRMAYEGRPSLPGRESMTALSEDSMDAKSLASANYFEHEEARLNMQRIARQEKWTIDDRLLLMRLRNHKRLAWKKIAQALPGRTTEALRVMHKKITFNDHYKTRLMRYCDDSWNRIYASETREDEELDSPMANTRRIEDQDQSPEGANDPSKDPQNQSGGRRNYTKEEDQLLWNLKRDQGLPWQEVFPYFPERSYHSLSTRVRVIAWQKGLGTAPTLARRRLEKQRDRLQDSTTCLQHEEIDGSGDVVNNDKHEPASTHAIYSISDSADESCSASMPGHLSALKKRKAQSGG